jgi:uncharacterized protein (TIGR02145 family)
MDNRKICPSGWKVPSDTDWNLLEGYLGQSNVALKLKSQSGWYGINTGTNESGFNALPSGYRDSRSGLFNTWTSNFSIFWSSSDTFYRIRYINGNSPNLYKHVDGSDNLGYFAIGEKRTGASIRCLKE